MKENEIERRDNKQEENITLLRKVERNEKYSSGVGLKACVVDMQQIQYLQVLK